MAKEEKKSFGAGGTNFEKYGHVISKKMKIEDLLEECAGRIFQINKEGTQFRMFDESNGTGTCAIVYRVAANKDEKKETKKSDTKKEEITKDDDDNLTYEDVMNMTRKELRQLIKENDLGTDRDQDLEDLQKDLIKELDLKPKKSSKKETKREMKKEENDGEEVEHDEKEIRAMNRKELKKYIRKYEIDVDPNDYDDDDDLADAVVEELDI